MRIPKVRQNAFLSPVQHNKGNPNKKPPKLMSLKPLRKRDAVYHIMGKDERHNPVGKLVLQVFNPEDPKDGKAAFVRHLRQPFCVSFQMETIISLDN